MMRTHTKLIILVISLGALPLAAVDNRKVEPASPSVEALLVSVNGDNRRIPADADVMVVAGDQLVLKQAVLTISNVKYGYIDLNGYSRKDAPQVLDDRNVTIHTDRDLVKSRAEDKSGEVYKITVGLGRKVYGTMRLRVVKPELRYAALDVNGQQKILRAGETAIFKASDKFKVQEVVTNVEGDDREVKYQLVPVTDRIELPTKVQFYELRFLRNGRIFAQIPLQIEER